MAPTEDDRLELQEVADTLGVHYQTAYRWVRSGQLPARLVNGRYVVTSADLARVEARRNTPAAPAAPSRQRLDRQADRMHDALVEGDEATARRIARRLVAEGTTIIELIQSVIVPPLTSIGRAWSDGELTIPVEHRASAIVDRILGELAPNPRGRRRGTAVVAAVAGDQHSLPTTMAAVTLREANWHVHHLGANVPGDELVRFCADHDVDVAVISVTNPETTDLATETAERLRADGTTTIVGGAGQPLERLIEDAVSSRPGRNPATDRPR